MGSLKSHSIYTHSPTLNMQKALFLILVLSTAYVFAEDNDYDDEENCDAEAMIAECEDAMAADGQFVCTDVCVQRLDYVFGEDDMVDLVKPSCQRLCKGQYHSFYDLVFDNWSG